MARSSEEMAADEAAIGTRRTLLNSPSSVAEEVEVWSIGHVFWTFGLRLRGSVSVDGRERGVWTRSTPDLS
jgi:hypothetical protein